MASRVYRHRDLKTAGVPFTRKHITTLEKRGEFPQHFNITDFSVGWVASEVDAWVESKIRSRAAAVPRPPEPKAAARNPPAPPHRGGRSAPVRSVSADDPRPRRGRAAAQAAS
jgi:predicted DNA-binding transcriptional regulator AlpA